MNTHEDSCQAQAKFTKSLGVDHKRVSKLLKALTTIQKQGNLVLYKLKPRDVEWHLLTWEQLLQRQKRKAFLHCIVTSDGKWIHYDNTKRRRLWSKPGHTSKSAANPNINGSKVLVSIWLNQLGVFLLWTTQTDQEKQLIYQQRYEKVILQNDNTWPPFAKRVKTWKLLNGNAVWLSLFPIDSTWTGWVEFSKWIDSWVALKDLSLFRCGIQMLIVRCEKRAASDGQYFQWHFSYKLLKIKITFHEKRRNYSGPW